MQPPRDRRHHKWTIAAFVAPVGGAALIGVLVWFLQGEGLRNADSYSSVLALLLSLVLALLALSRWAWQRRRKSMHALRPDLNLDNALDQLRLDVHEQWTRELAHRRLLTPKALRLSLRPVQQPGLQAGVVSVPASLPPDAGLEQLMRDEKVRQLVLLGEPGAGKTTTALLYVTAAAGESGPVAVPLSAALWDPERRPFTAWAVDQIVEGFPPLTRKQVERLLATGRLIPVVDDFDALPPSARIRAFGRLEIAEKSGVRTVITCRLEQFAQTVSKANVLPAALVVELEPVSSDIACEYLVAREPSGSTRWKSVISRLQSPRKNALSRTLNTPLMIAFARQAYANVESSPRELTRLSSRRKVRDQIIDRYFTSVYADRAPTVRRHLALLASHLGSHREDPNMAWWRAPTLVSRFVIVALIMILGTVAGALVLAVYVLVDGYLVSRGSWVTGVIGPQGPYSWSWITIGAGVGLAAGIVAAIAAVRVYRPWKEPPRRQRWWAISSSVRDVAVALTLLWAVSTVTVIFAERTGDHTATAVHLIVIDILRLPSHSVQGYQVFNALFVLSAVVGSIAVTRSLWAGHAGQPRRLGGKLRQLPSQLGAGLLTGALVGAPWLLLGVLALLDLDVAGGIIVMVLAAIGVGVPAGVGRWLRSPADLRVPVFSPRSSLGADRRALILMVVVVETLFVAETLELLSILEGFGTGVIPVVLCSAVFCGIVVTFGSGSAWVGYALAVSWLAVTRRVPWRLFQLFDDARAAGVVRQAGVYHQIGHELIRTYLLDEGDTAQASVGRAQWVQRLTRARPTAAVARRLRSLVPTAATPVRRAWPAAYRLRQMIAVVGTLGALLAPLAILSEDPRGRPQNLIAGSGFPERVDWSPDGRWLAVTYHGYRTTLVNLRSGAMTTDIAADWVFDIPAFHLPRVSGPGFIDEWDRTGRYTLLTADGSAALTNDGLLVTLPSVDKQGGLRCTDGGVIDCKQKDSSDPATAGTGPLTLTIWNSRTVRAVWSTPLDPGTAAPWCSGVSSTGQSAFVVSAAGLLRLWDIRSRKVIATAQVGAAYNCRFSSDGTRLAIAAQRDGLGHRVSVWQTSDGSQLSAVETVEAVSEISPDCQTFVTNNTLGDISTGGALARFPSWTHFRYSPDGQWLSAVGAAGNTYLVNAHTGRRGADFGNTAVIIVFGPDPEVVGVIDSVNVLSLRRTNDGTQLRIVDRVGRPTNIAGTGFVDQQLAAFSIDGRQLATISWNNVVRVWGNLSST